MAEAGVVVSTIKSGTTTTAGKDAVFHFSLLG